MKQEKENKELAKRDAGEVAALMAESGVIYSGDMEIAKVLITQKMSKILDEDKTARPGELRDSLEGKLLGGEETPFKAVVFKWHKTWTVTEGPSGGKQEWVRNEPFTAKNCNREREEWFTGQAGQMKREFNETFHFFLIDVTDGEYGVPYIFSMSRTARPTAKKLLTVFAKLGKRGEWCGDYVAEFTTQREDGDKGTYYIPTFKLGEKAPAAVSEAARHWLKTMSQSPQSFKVHEAPVDEPQGKVREVVMTAEQERIQF